MKVLKIVNKLDLNDNRNPLKERVITFEDEQERKNTDIYYLNQQDPIYERLLISMREIHAHFRRSQDSTIQSGNFFFKL